MNAIGQWCTLKETQTLCLPIHLETPMSHYVCLEENLHGSAETHYNDWEQPGNRSPEGAPLPPCPSWMGQIFRLCSSPPTLFPLPQIVSSADEETWKRPVQFVLTYTYSVFILLKSYLYLTKQRSQEEWKEVCLAWQWGCSWGLPEPVKYSEISNSDA